MKFFSLSTCLKAAAVLLALAACSALGLAQYLPEAVPAEQLGQNPPQDGPRLQTAIGHIQNIARSPHVPQTDAQLAAAEYILSTLNSYGLTPVVESDTFTVEQIVKINNDLGWRSNEEEVRDYADMDEARNTLTVTNIWTWLDLAPDTDEAVLMLAHYDSVKFGSGAGDDAMSAATLLETVRLMNNHYARRDLIVLFTDGEEQGMLGADAFVRAHPELDIVHVTNVECRGSTGAMLLFETSPNNLSLVSMFGRAVPHPVGNSIAQQVYQMMSSDTDFSIFRNAGYRGVNLSLIDGAWVYHTADDTLQNLSRASLWHYLRTVPPLANSLVSADARQFEPAAEDAIFFPFLNGFVVWPESIALPLSILAVVWSLGLIMFQLRKQAGLRPLLGAFVWQILAVAACALLGFAAVKITGWAAGVSSEREFLRLASAGFIALSLTVLTLILSAFAAWRSARSPVYAIAAMLPLLAILSVVIAAVMPGGAYLLALPVIAQCCCLQLYLARYPGAFLRTAFHAVGTLLSILTISLIITPVAYLVYVALSLRMIYAALLLLSIGAVMMFASAWAFIRGQEAGFGKREEGDRGGVL